jgi:nitrous oxidase accessory protein NosD
MRRRLATLAATTLMLALLVPVAAVSADSHGAIHVRPGQSIQAAIDSAPAGATIHLARGTYRENIEVAASNIRLVGDHAVLVPAADPTFNLCLTPGFFDGVAGVCIHGVPVIADGQMVGVTPISNVSFEGITVRNFSGPGIVAIGVDGLRLIDVVTAHSGEMGMFINMVTSFSLRDSRSYDNHGDGVFMENLREGSKDTNTVVTGNKSWDNLGSGIIFINSLGGRIANNDLHGNCAGIQVWAFAGGYGSVSGDVSIKHNRVTANNRWCPADNAGAPDYGGIGIGLIGAQNTKVAHNDVRNNRAQVGSVIHGGGIVILTAAATDVSPGSPLPTGNSVRSNRLSGNSPFDIYGDGTGSHNTVRGNSCHTTNLRGC